MYSSSVALLSLLSLVAGQQVGTLTTETHPTLNIQQCSAGGSCTTQARSVTLDSNWRWLHTTSGSTNCYTGNTWDATLCPDPATCAKNCALDGADYVGTYGVQASGSSLAMKFVQVGPYSTSIGSRVYLMKDASTYQTFNLLNQEFTFDVNMANLPCGLNGALYFVEMPADGGMSANAGNKAGAKYGTGYCDTQCPHDIKFINGEANLLNWTPSSNDENAGAGKYGACCNEMDIWEANINAAAYTPHVCSKSGLTRCDSATTCGDGDSRYSGVCDKDGCDFNSFRMGNKTFLGAGLTVDTSKTITVVTQFITSDNTATGTLTEIRRQYVQNGKVIPNSQSTISGVTGNSITDSFCSAAKTAFGDNNSFAKLGGLKAMGQSFQKGMVLVMSIWDDHSANMLWLDSNYPTTKSASTPGVARGTCATTSGVPSDVEKNVPNSSVTYSNIKYGPIGSTFKAT